MVCKSTVFLGYVGRCDRVISLGHAVCLRPMNDIYPNAFAQPETSTTDIDGPIEVGVVGSPPQGDHARLFSFAEELEAAGLTAQGETFAIGLAGLTR